MTPNEINAFLKLASITNKRLAKDFTEQGHPCTEQDINKTILGHQKNQRIRELIEKRFGMRPGEMFGKDHELAVQARKRAA
jgi:hypothetical protein